MQIRTELEMSMTCNLREFKEYIDNEMIVILGQMDSPTEIFEHVYLVGPDGGHNLLKRGPVAESPTHPFASSSPRDQSGMHPIWKSCRTAGKTKTLDHFSQYSHQNIRHAPVLLLE